MLLPVGSVPREAMRLLDIQEAYTRKFERQAGVPGLELHAAGHCAHIGALSPGCYGCFAPTATWGVRLGEDVGLPNVCNMDCPHCFREHEVRTTYEPPPGWTLPQKAKDEVLLHFMRFSRLKSLFVLYNFSGVSEPLFYVPVISQYLNYFRNVIEKDILATRGWAKLYTNGTRLDRDMAMRLRDMGCDEVRVNPSASGFSKEVYRNIETAAACLPVVTVEVPSWPLYRKQLLEMLPIIANLGVRHLDVCQVEILNLESLARVRRLLPDADVYQGHWMMLDDGGMVEEIMRTAIANAYPYSVLDCNAFVKQVNGNECMKNGFYELANTQAFEQICSLSSLRRGSVERREDR
jgi:hypothetical protein